MSFVSLSMAFFLLLAPSAKPQPPASGPVVHIANGSLAGAMNGNIAAFKGIPYAQPPIGSLRWREPQPPAAWQGVRDATKPSAPCMQNPAGTDSFIKPLAEAYGASYQLQTLSPSEDCLYLNVWTPQLDPAAHLPVMVWVHGGSNRVGSGSEPGYDGTSFAQNGVVFVTINYRLGIMGFFVHPELTAESPHHSSGNYGLLDQIAALRWVQQNIAQFGGDPANVTLFGESAGSIDSVVLMTSPLTTGLFRRVIAESGPAFGLGPSRNVAQLEPLGLAIGNEAGAPAGAQLAVLRQTTPEKLTDIQNRLLATTFRGYDPVAAIVDGWLLPQSPARAFASGKIENVDLLAGVNAREFSAFRVGAETAQKHAPAAPKAKVSDSVKVFADTARPLYGSWTDVAVGAYVLKILVQGNGAIDQASNDIVAACPTGAEAALAYNAGRHAYVYLFARSVPGKGEAELGAFHSLEIPYVFGNFGVRTFSWLPVNATDLKLSKTVQAYWINFAKSGDPNGGGLAHWEPWTPGQEPYMKFSQSGEAVAQHGFSPPYCHLAPSRLKEQLGH